MKGRILLATGALFLSTVAIGSAKSWDIFTQSSTKAGSLMLPAGNYKIKVDNAQATFTEIESGKKYTAPVKIEKAPKKFDATAVESQHQGDVEIIQAIDLGGTTDKLEFGE